MVSVHWQGYECIARGGMKMFDFIPLGISYINTVKLEKTLYLYFLLWTVTVTWKTT